MIPVNKTNVTEAVKEAENCFAAQIEEMENKLFDPERFEEYKGIQHMNVGCYGFSLKFKFPITEEHWKVLFENVKKAGYFVYKKWYHNRHYNETKIQAYVVTKAPLNGFQRELLSIQKEWNGPFGPGGEQYRGEQL